MLAPWKESYDKPRQCIKKQRHHFAGSIVKAVVFPIRMWELNPKEGWSPKNGCFWIVLEMTLESPLDYKEIKPVNRKGNQPWIFIKRTDVKLQYFGHLMRRADSLEKTLTLGKIEDRKRRGRQRMRWFDASLMVHWFSGHEFEQTLRNGEGQRSLVCCSPWGCRESDRT